MWLYLSSATRGSVALLLSYVFLWNANMLTVLTEMKRESLWTEQVYSYLLTNSNIA